MMKKLRNSILFVAAFVMISNAAWGQSLPEDIKVKAETKISQLRAWGTDPQIVSAVQAYNAAPPADAKDMSNEKWKGMSVLDPTVRSYSKNGLAEYLKTKKDDSISEIFVSGANGAKVAFLSKPTSWNHKGKPKHDVPMSGKVYVGPVEVDESSGQQQFQVGLPVLAGGKPIGSMVVGLRVASLK